MDKNRKGAAKGDKGKGKSVDYAAVEPSGDAQSSEPEREDSSWWMTGSYDKIANLLTRDVLSPP